jgi:ATP-binding cassette subfamily B protein
MAGFVDGAPGFRRNRPVPTLRSIVHLKRLFPYLHRYRWPLGAAIGGILVTRLADSTIPLLMKSAIDSLDAGRPALLLPALGILGLTALRFAIFVFSRRIIRRISIATSYDLRKRIFAHVQRQGPGFFARIPTGDVMSRAISDIGLIRRVVAFGAVQVLTMTFTFVTALSFMWSLSPLLTLLVLPPLPFIGVFAFRMSRVLFPYVREQQQAMADVTSFVQENFNGIRTIQSMAQEDREIGRFRAVSTHYADLLLRATRYRALMNAVMPLLSAMSPVIVLTFGGSMVLRGEISLGTMTAFLAYMTMMLMPVRMIGMTLSMFSTGAAGTARVFEVLDAEPEIVDAPRDDVPEKVSGRIEVRELRYTPPGAGRPALDGVSLTVEPGETVAILGRVGSGKSTLLQALVRLIDTPPGSVLLDGHDVRDYPLKRLRREVVLVPQDPFLFSERIDRNVTYDEPERPTEAVWEAAEAAQLAATVRSFPLELRTLVGERGVTLSGGQKQRATLARGLIRDAAVLALDDCFSSVDTETEERILAALTHERGRHTTLLVSHRVSTARQADRIYVLDGGRIVESGTHAELLSRGGYYADLSAVQSNQDADRARRDALVAHLRAADARAVEPATADAGT